MKSKSSRIALVLVTGLIAGASAFAQAAPGLTPHARMDGATGSNMMHAKQDGSMSMGMHATGSHALSATLNPRVRIY